MSNLNNTTLANNMEGGNEVYFINLLHHKIPKMLDCLEGFLHEMHQVLLDDPNGDENLRVKFINDILGELVGEIDNINSTDPQVFYTSDQLYDKYLRNSDIEFTDLYEDLFYEFKACRKFVATFPAMSDRTLEILDCVDCGLVAIIEMLDLIR